MAVAAPASFNPKRLTEARLLANMSRADLAYEIRKSEQNIGRWERGEHEPRGETVALIAAVTGKPLDYFYSRDPEALRDADKIDTLVKAFEAFLRQTQRAAA